MSKRTEQVSQLIQNQLGEIISREVELPEGSLVTIVKVEVSPDLKHSNVWISILPTNLRGTVLESLRKNMGQIQKNLSRRIAIKFTPKIFFKVDITGEHVNEVDGILDKIKKDQE